MPSNSKSTRVPHPAAIVEPEKENARTFVFPADTVKPESVASPPEAETTELTPSTLN